MRFIPYGSWLLLVAGHVEAQTSTTTTTTNIPPSINTDHRLFADALTQQLYNADNSNTNEFTSTWSISLALALLYPAAIGDSKTQLETVVRLPPTDASSLVWQDTTTRLQSAYDGSCPYDDEECYGQNPELVVSYRLFVDDSKTLEPTYASLVNEYAESLDLQSPDAGSIINGWVNDTTQGLISSIVPEGPQEDGMDAIILNALYLKAIWQDAFDAQYTNQDDFYTDPTRSTATTTTTAQQQTQFMHDVRYGQAYSDTAVPGFQILQLGFQGENSGRGDGSLSAIFALPIPGTDDTAATTWVSSAEVLAALPLLDRRRVAMGLPKFQFETEYQDILKTSLQQIGLVEPFDEFCDTLCVFDDNQMCQAYIAKIIHKTFVNLNEDGIEAAAVTALGLVATSLPLPEEPVLFLADRPFQFFIYDTTEDLVLFEGHITNPVVADDAAPSQLEASHSDVDFWKTQFGVDSLTQPNATATATTVDTNSDPEAEEPTSTGATTAPTTSPPETTNGPSVTATTTAPIEVLQEPPEGATGMEGNPATSSAQSHFIDQGMMWMLQLLLVGGALVRAL